MALTQPFRHESDVVYTEPVVRSRPILPAVAAVIGGAMFLVGLVAVFRVDFGGDLLATTGTVVGFGFSPVLAIATVLLGGAALVAAISDRDSGSTAFVGLLTIVVAIVGLMLNGRMIADTLVSVDRQALLALALAGAGLFLVGLMPWWTVRRQRTVARYDR